MQFLALIIFCLVNIPLALVVYINNPKSWTNKLFAALIVILTVYLFVNAQIYVNHPYPLRLFFARFIMFNASYINLLVFLFLATFPQSQIPVKRTIIYLASLVTILLSLVAFYTPFIFENITINQNNVVTPVAGMLMPVFMLHTFIFVIGGFVALIKKYKKSTGLSRLKLRYIFFAFVLLFFFILVFNFLFPVLLHIGIFVPLLPIYILIFLVLVSYSIIRHRLLDIRFLATRAVAYIFLIVIIAVVISSVVFIAGQTLGSISFSQTQLLFVVVVSVIIALSFHPARRSIEKFTDRILYKDRYNSDRVLNHLAHIMASTLRLEDLTHGVLGILIQEVKVTEAAFILLNLWQIADVKSEGFDSAPALDEEEIKQISQTRDTIVFDDLEEGPIKEILRKLGLSVAVHLRTEGMQIGLLVLGPKSSGDIYSEQDLSLLEILAPEAAVAIQNAQAYEEIRRFSITLQEEVDRATSDLQRANEKLEVLDKLKDEFVSLASHELRTPMTAIKSYAWMVLNGKAGDLTPKASEYIDRVYESTERLIHLVNEMLDVSRIESGKVQLSIEPFDMVVLAHDVQAEFQARVAEREQTLEVHTDGILPKVAADREKIHQVLENLIGNSVKFTHKGGKIMVNMKVNEGHVEIAVKDTGMGISKQDIPKLFSKFGRIQSSLEPMVGNGSGLGLYISKQYVDLHHGTIWVDSEVDKGTTFVFTLPIAKEGLPSTKTKPQSSLALPSHDFTRESGWSKLEPDMADQPHSTTVKKRILVVEDEKFLLDLYADILTEAGFQVDKAADGEQGYNAMHQGGYDLILLDIMLPKMDGLKIMEKLAQETPPLKPNGMVVVLSNLGQDTAIASAVALGARGYMIKSDYTPDQVITKVKSFLTS